MAATSVVMRHPEILPGDPNDPNSLTHLARTNPQDPRVVHRIRLLANPDARDGDWNPPRTLAEEKLNLTLGSAEGAFGDQYADSHPEDQS